jgi:hypothetical protein
MTIHFSASGLSVGRCFRKWFWSDGVGAAAALGPNNQYAVVRRPPPRKYVATSNRAWALGRRSLLGALRIASWSMPVARRHGLYVPEADVGDL